MTLQQLRYAVTVAEPTFTPTEFPVSVTVQPSEPTKPVAVHVVECEALSYVHEEVPQLRPTSLALIVRVAVFVDGRA